MKEEDKSLISKRFQTTMIGAIFEFENAFGYLWGHHKDENEPLTEQEIKFGDIWDNVRNKILNNGNNQLRKTIADLSRSNNIKYNYKFYKQGE
jgi:hypothetical protein